VFGISFGEQPFVAGVFALEVLISPTGFCNVLGVASNETSCCSVSFFSLGKSHNCRSLFILTWMLESMFFGVLAADRRFLDGFLRLPGRERGFLKEPSLVGVAILLLNSGELGIS